MGNKKLAIVIGHNSQSQGAVRKDTGETEYSFNNRIAMWMEEFARKMYPDLEIAVFRRQPLGSYTREINRVYDQTDAWGAHLTMELHFNSSGDTRATGTETLTSGTPASMAAAVAVNEEVVAALGLRDRGVKTRRSGRGSQSLISGRAPAILVEPYFGSSPKGLEATDEDHEEQALAMAYIRGAAKALSVMPRQDLSGSRTKKTANQAKTVSKVGQAGATAGILAYLGDASGVMEAADVVERVGLAGWLPYIAIGGMVIALLVLFVIPAMAEWIKQYREEDHEKYNGS